MPKESSDEHPSWRTARLESASRFQPVQISTWNLTLERSLQIEDFSYDQERRPQHPQTCAFQGVLREGCGVVPCGANSHESVLHGFRLKGAFCAKCVECPTVLNDNEEFDALAPGMAPTFERRIRSSYRPKSILLISERLSGVAEALGRAKP